MKNLDAANSEIYESVFTKQPHNEPNKNDSIEGK